MHWFFITLGAPALWAVCNHIDKHLLEKYFKNAGVGALMIFSALIGVFVVPLIVLFHPSVLIIEPLQAILLITESIIMLLAVLIYLHALRNDEASIIVPLFQTMPIFLFILARIFLKEHLTTLQIVGGSLIIIGAVAISLDIRQTLPKFKAKIFFPMIFSSFLLSVSALIFKFVALETNFWTATFWEYLGGIVLGFFFLLFIKKYRKDFVKTFQNNRSHVVALNGLNEILNIAATMLMRFASLLAPLAVVQVMNGFQSVFVFVYGIALTLLFPRFSKESLIKKDLAQRIVAIIIIFVGSYMIQK